MAWRLKLYPTADACFDAHRDSIPIGTGWRDVDGVVYLATPGGLCNLTCHSITGEGDTLTADPSILVSKASGPTYHGWLKNGVLSDDCEGRTYPHFPGNA
jgi:hypothetical protein